MEKARKNNKKRRYPPAYYRYRESHKIVSVVLSNDLKGFLDSSKRAGMTYSDMIKDGLNNGNRIYQAALSECDKRFNDKLRKIRYDIMSSLVKYPEGIRKLNRIYEDNGIDVKELITGRD